MVDPADGAVATQLSPRGTPSRRPPRRQRQVLIGDRELAAATEAELIARVLGGSEPAAEVLRCGAELARLPSWRRRSLGARGLVDECGLSPDRAVRLAALWELADRWFPDDRPTVSSPRDALLLLDDLRTARAERIVALLLDARHRLLGIEVVAVGTLNASRLQPRDVFAPALLSGAAAVLVAHNHPSGEPAPSRADRAVTAALRQAGGVLGVQLLDHLVVARRGHYSFRDSEGWSEEPPA